ncbi:MAG: V-type ATP synthase subunit E [Trueperaceae bacterium]
MADLAALLDKEASAEIEGILSEARERASEVVAGAQAEAEALLASRKRTALANGRSDLVRARSAAQLESSSLTLRAQHSAIEDVFKEAEVRIEALTRGPTYVAVLTELLQEALSASGAAPSTIRAVIVNPSDKEAAATAADGLSLAGKVTTDPHVRAGVRIDGGESNFAIENTLYGRLASLREELASEVAQVLLSKEG